MTLRIYEPKFPPSMPANMPYVYVADADAPPPPQAGKLICATEGRMVCRYVEAAILRWLDDPGAIVELYPYSLDDDGYMRVEYTRSEAAKRIDPLEREIHDILTRRLPLRERVKAVAALVRRKAGIA